jgi:hypothetical protein
MSVAAKAILQRVEFLKRLSDNGRHKEIPGLSAGACWELAIELEQFVKSISTAAQKEPAFIHRALVRIDPDGTEVWEETPLFEAAQRQWVGLTAGEMLEALTSADPETRRLPIGFSRFAQAIEAKLREKNAASSPTIPDAMTRADCEGPEYTSGWNDCRAEILKGMK